MSAALDVLGYFELPEEDTPPEEYWHYQDRLSEWFEAVKARREERYGGGSSSAEPAEDMTGNEFAKQFV